LAFIIPITVNQELQPLAGYRVFKGRLVSHRRLPGDFNYREFYRDIGYDLDYNYVKPYLNGDGGRMNTGIQIPPDNRPHQ